MIRSAIPPSGFSRNGRFVTFSSPEIVRSVRPPTSRKLNMPEFSRCLSTFGCSATFLKVMRLPARSIVDSCTNASASGGTSFGPTFLIIGTGTQRSRHDSRPPSSLRSMGLMSLMSFMCDFMKSGNAGSDIASITASTGASNVCLSSNFIAGAPSLNCARSLSQDLVFFDREHRRAEADAHRLLEVAVDLGAHARLQQIGAAAFELVGRAVLGLERPVAAFEVRALHLAFELRHESSTLLILRAARIKDDASERKEYRLLGIARMQPPPHLLEVRRVLCRRQPLQIR